MEAVLSAYVVDGSRVAYLPVLFVDFSVCLRGRQLHPCQCRRTVCPIGRRRPRSQSPACLGQRHHSACRPLLRRLVPQNRWSFSRRPRRQHRCRPPSHRPRPLQPTREYRLVLLRHALRRISPPRPPPPPQPTNPPALPPPTPTHPP